MRVRQDKTPRPYKKCTSCGDDLPRNRPQWGLVWGDNISGMCKGCLRTQRLGTDCYDKYPDLARKDRVKKVDGRWEAY